jgi:TPR repeat protein
MQASDPGESYYRRAQTVAGAYGDRNAVRIVALLEEAASYEHADALFELGNWHHYGIGVPRDDRKAAGLWERAVARGHGGAAFNLAIAYERGIGVVRDPARAFALYDARCEAGDVSAFYEVGRCAYYGIGIPQDRTRARAALERARAFGHPEALCDAAEDAEPRRMPRPNVAGPFHATRGG